MLLFQEVLDEPFKDTMMNEAHMSDRQRGIVLRVFISRMRQLSG